MKLRRRDDVDDELDDGYGADHGSDSHHRYDHLDPYDDLDDEFSTGFGDRWRRLGVIVAVIAAVAMVIAVGPLVLDRLAGEGEPVDRTAAPIDSTGPSVTAAASSTTDAPLVVETTMATPVATTVGTPPERASLPPVAPVSTIQLIPPARDVIVLVGGLARSSDAFGRIDVSAAAPGDTIEFVGIDVTPAITRADFRAWSDGSTATVRPLAELTGPTAGLAVVLSNRVVVRSADGTVGTVEFSSEAGTLRLDTEVPSWVPFAQGIVSDQGLLSQQLTYTATTFTSADTTTSLAQQPFIASPEAAWTVRTASPTEVG